MQFTMKLSLDNAAFDDPGELSRILRDVAKRVEGVDLNNPEGCDPYDGNVTVRDINGNRVGEAKITGKRG